MRLLTLFSGKYVNNFIVGLTNTAPTSISIANYTLCGQWPGTAPDGQTLPVRCADGLPPFRYVIILNNNAEYLAFCELQVFGTGQFAQFVLLLNFAFLYIAKQLSCYYVKCGRSMLLTSYIFRRL